MKAKATCISCRSKINITPARIIKYKTPNKQFLFMRCPCCGSHLPISKKFLGAEFCKACAAEGKQ